MFYLPRAGYRPHHYHWGTCMHQCCWLIVSSECVTPPLPRPPPPPTPHQVGQSVQHDATTTSTCELASTLIKTWPGPTVTIVTKFQWPAYWPFQWFLRNPCVLAVNRPQAAALMARTQGFKVPPCIYTWIIIKPQVSVSQNANYGTDISKSHIVSHRDSAPI